MLTHCRGIVTRLLLWQLRTVESKQHEVDATRHRGVTQSLVQFNGMRAAWIKNDQDVVFMKKIPKAIKSKLQYGLPENPFFTHKENDDLIVVGGVVEDFQCNNINLFVTT